MKTHNSITRHGALAVLIIIIAACEDNSNESKVDIKPILPKQLDETEAAQTDFEIDDLVDNFYLSPGPIPNSFEGLWEILAIDIDVHVIGKHRVRMVRENGEIYWGHKIFPLPYWLVMDARSLKSWNNLVEFGSRDPQKALSQLRAKWESQPKDDLGLLDDIRPIIPILFLEIAKKNDLMDQVLKDRRSFNAFLSDRGRITELMSPNRGN